LDDRKNKIASEFKKAEDLQSETIKLKADYEQRIKGLEDSARVKIQEAVQEGKRVAEEIKKNAQEESDKLVKSAKQSIQQEISAAETRLREEIVKIAIKAAEDVIEKRYNSDDDKRIVEDFVKNIEKI
jgi:F-type H+-transporting ATPase subunit b